jgi:hypothetical protein
LDVLSWDTVLAIETFDGADLVFSVSFVFGAILRVDASKMLSSRCFWREQDEFGNDASLTLPSLEVVEADLHISSPRHGVAFSNEIGACTLTEADCTGEKKGSSNEEPMREVGKERPSTQLSMLFDTWEGNRVSPSWEGMGNIQEESDCMRNIGLSSSKYEPQLLWRDIKLPYWVIDGVIRAVDGVLGEEHSEYEPQLGVSCCECMGREGGREDELAGSLKLLRYASTLYSVALLVEYAAASGMDWRYCCCRVEASEYNA